MPIKLLRKGLPVVLHAKIGANYPKNSPQNGAPYKFDHIELAGTDRDGDGNLLPDKEVLAQLAVVEGVPLCGGCARSKKLGFPKGLPTRIEVYVPYNDIDLVFPHRMAMYRGRRAFCVGDMETAERREVLEVVKNVPKFGEFKPHEPCGATCEDFLARRCKPNGKLRFELAGNQRAGTVGEFRTTSWRSIANIVASLEDFKVKTGGVLQGIPLYLEISEQTVIPMDGGAPQKAMIAHVSFPGTSQQLLEAGSEYLRLRAPVISEMRRLEASIERGATWDETTEEVEAVTAEFYDEPNTDAEPKAKAKAKAKADTGEGDPFDGTKEEVEAEAKREEPSKAEPEPEMFGEEDADAAADPSTVREGDVRPVSSEGQQNLLVAKAEHHAGRVGMAPSDAYLIVNEALATLEIPSLSDVRLPEMNDMLTAIGGYEVDSEAS